MNFELSYFIGPVVGAFVGFITNDVAIRLLFKPHFPKYMLFQFRLFFVIIHVFFLQKNLKSCHFLDVFAVF